MNFSPAIQARIAAASLTVQQLVYDVVIDRLMTPHDVDARVGDATEVVTMDAVELDRLTRLIKRHVPDAERGQWPYRPDADAIAFGVAALAGRTMVEIAKFFGTEYQYARTKLRRLREHARAA